MSNILFLTQVLPYPLDSGAKIRQYHMIEYLGQRHEVTVVAFVRPDNTPEQVAKLTSICHVVHTVPIQRSIWRNARAFAASVLGSVPAVIARDAMAEMRALVGRLVTETCFDVVHADQISMAQYGLYAVERARRNGGQLPSLIDMHNAMYLVLERLAKSEANLVKRWLLGREARLMANYEAHVCRTYDQVLTVTAEDKEQLLALYARSEREALAARFHELPICVDPASVMPIPHVKGPPTILHLGTMFWWPNSDGVLWFAKQVLPLIWEREPETRFLIVGKDPPPVVKALAMDERIAVTGYVEDPLPYLEQADVFIVPLRAAGGMRVKILDGWQWALPIVSTTIGAEGIAIRDGENILIADEPATFAQAVLTLLVDEARNAALRRRGRVWVEERYAWPVTYQLLDNVYERLWHWQGKRKGLVNKWN